MTRENKLALVVGFGLLLVVAILISDHFSTVRDQQPANLLPVNDPLRSAHLNDPRIIEFGPAAAVAETLADTRPRPGSEMMRDDGPPVVGGRRSISMGDLQGQPRPNRPGTAERLHHVAQNEYLSTICRNYYGDASLVDELAAYNGIGNPDLIRAGHAIRIPEREVLDGGQPAPSETRVADADAGTRGTQEPPAPRTYTIQGGDILSTLSRRFLGTSTRWRELYELNRDVIQNPDRLLTGTVIRLPD